MRDWTIYQVNFLRKFGKIYSAAKELAKDQNFGTSFSTMYDEMQPIVIDNGSSIVRAGYAGEAYPMSVFHPSLGTLRPNVEKTTPFLPDSYIGNDAYAMSGILTLKNPIEQGAVTNWDSMTKIWEHAFYHELGVPPAQHPIILTEPRKVNKADREKMAEIMFETFSVPSFYLGMQAVFSVYSACRTTGIALDSGESSTDIVPVYEGCSMTNAIKRVSVGGHDVSNRLLHLLDRGWERPNFSTKIMRDMMKKVSRVALDFDQEMYTCESLKYILPDDEFIYVDNRARIECSEILFRPYLNGTYEDGVHLGLVDSINMCDADVRQFLYNNIILSGGTTMINGFPERLDKEIQHIATMRQNVITPLERDLMAWLGGSIFGSLPLFPQMAVTYHEYYENGVRIVHRKCL